MQKLRIVFMGTPQFAVPIVEAIFHSKHELVGVVTAEDKPSGRGLKVTESEVKKAAFNFNVPILQPNKLKSPDFIDKLSSLNADIFIVVAFRMLPEIVWSMPRLGTYNLHASLLPQYRGAAPINWAIINGEKTTGLTTFKLQHEIDTGNILLKNGISIGENETFGELYSRMMHLGADLVIQSLDLIASGEYTLQPQSEIENITHAPKIYTETGKINWELESSQIHNLIRGLNPYPSAYGLIQKKKIKIHKTLLANIQLEPGTFEFINKKLIVGCGNNTSLEILELQPEGKKTLKALDFINGYQNGTKQFDI